MAAKKSKQRKFRRPKPIQEKLIGFYVAGFIEALRLQNGMPAGVTYKKTISDRTKWARRSFELHSPDRGNRMPIGDELETIHRSKSGAPPDFKFISRLAKSYLPEKFVHVSVPSQNKNVTGRNSTVSHLVASAH
jgi:hypothetical protein